MEKQSGQLNSNVASLPLRSLAHIGDAVYEVFVREKTIFLTSKPDKIHKITISVVNAGFQADLLEALQSILTDDEKEIVRRGRNLQVTTARRTNHTLHRLSTAFEALIGYLYLTDKARLDEVYEFLTPFIQEKVTEE